MHAGSLSLYCRSVVLASVVMGCTVQSIDKSYSNDASCNEYAYARAKSLMCRGQNDQHVQVRKRYGVNNSH